MMHDPPRWSSGDSVTVGTIAAVIVGVLLVGGVIVWGLDSHLSRMTAESSPPATVGQGASRIDQSFSQIESAPAAVTAPAIKLEPSTGDATKAYDLEKKDQ